MRISDWSSDVCSSDLHAADLHSFLTALIGETEIDRGARLRLLGRFAREDFRDALPDGVDPVHDSSRARGRSRDGSPLSRVIPAPEYYRAAMRPIGELKIFSAGKDRKSTRLNSSH